MQRIEDCGFTEQEVRIIREACRLFNAQKVWVIDRNILTDTK